MDKPASPTVAAQISNLAASLHARDKAADHRFHSLEVAYNALEDVLRKTVVWGNAGTGVGPGVGVPLPGPRDRDKDSENFSQPHGVSSQAEDKRDRGISRAFSYLAVQIDRLDGVVGELEKTIGPILHAVPPDNANTSGARPSSGSSGMAGAVDSLAGHVEAITARLSGLVHRVEL